jgi:hypothetical protein
LRLTRLSLSIAAAAVLAAGCGGGDDTSSSASDEEPTSTASATSSASATPTPSEADMPGGCTPPAHDVAFKRGTASLDVTEGPDPGHYDLALDPIGDSAYAASDKEITGSWISADEKAVLSIDIEGVDPCHPDAFTSIGTQGAAGPLFIDSSHTACKVELTSLGAKGAQGTFTCQGLLGGGEGLERDAEGTFTLEH